MTIRPSRMKVYEKFQPGLPKFVQERIQTTTNRNNQWAELKISLSYLILSLAGAYFTIMGLIEWINWEYVILGQVFTSIRHILQLTKNKCTK